MKNPRERIVNITVKKGLNKSFCFDSVNSHKLINTNINPKVNTPKTCLVILLRIKSCKARGENWEE
ncbi:hypothetical protein GCM10007111_15940 [Virgibacillus kapii]|uniref:Uncharacterized protein n=1 Tax=Virgibacillus kapii TaxID=1638645 RepID=A0ABQ2DDM0_9BACI|nr:hypothetical protein GCM10007111_15940 [Virgibacillus kapii]